MEAEKKEGERDAERKVEVYVQWREDRKGMERWETGRWTEIGGDLQSGQEEVVFGETTNE